MAVMTKPKRVKITKEEAQATYDSCKNSIEYFAQFFFPHIVNYQVAPFHKEIYEDLLVSRYYACAAPRGHAKSTIGLVLNTIHYALFRAIGDITLLSLSEDFVINEIVRVIKGEFESNAKLKYYFGDMKTKKWSETYFVLKNGVAFEAGGIGGQLRGGRRGLIALDDLESNESVDSAEQRNKLENRINKELIPKLLPNGQMAYFGTLISPLCYLKKILEEDNAWRKRNYDCYIDGIEDKGHELWPEMLPHDELQRRKGIMGTNAFQSEYRNNPISEATAAIKADMIREWEKLPPQRSLVMTVDPAYSEDPKADYKAYAIISNDVNNNRYLESYMQTHKPQGEFIDSILNAYLQNKSFITAVGIPCSGGDKEFWNSILKQAGERGLTPPFVELKNSFTTASGVSKRNKKARAIAALQPLFENGKYYIHKSHVEAKEQLLQLNPVTDQKHDDVLDTLSYAEQIIQPYFKEGGSNITEVDRYGTKTIKTPMGGARLNNYGMD